MQSLQFTIFSVFVLLKCFGCEMAFHWIPPPPGVLKINVHGIHSTIQLPNGNNSGIGAVYRGANGDLKLLTLGVVPGLSSIGNQLWAVYAPMRRAFKEGYRNVMIETDNFDAFKAIRDFSAGAPPAIYHLLSQIEVLMNNNTWACSIAFIFAARNRPARYAARLGMEIGEQLYTMEHPVGGVQEYIDWDMGMGVEHPDFVDVFLPLNAPDPVNFDMALGLADQVDILGLGQADAPNAVQLDVEEGEPEMGVGEVQEGVVQGNMQGANFFPAAPPMGDLVDVD